MARVRQIIYWLGWGSFYLDFDNAKKPEKIGIKTKPKKFDRKTFHFGIFQGMCFLRSINFAGQRPQIQGFIVT